MRGRWAVLLGLVLCQALGAGSVAASPGSAAHTLYLGALHRYHSGDYEGAAEGLEHAVALAPRRSEYHRWLGRTYGRLAEQAGWFEALKLARRTVAEFERAVALAPSSEPALEDLLSFYEQAPAIVGGGEDKAARVRAHLERLRTGDHSGASP